MNKKVLNIIEGALTVVLGILVAVFGGLAVMNIYFGVLLVVFGAGLAAFAIYTLVKTKVVTFLSIFLACVALLFGIVLLAGYYSLDYLLQTLLLVVIAAGGALIFYGVYSIAKRRVFLGVGQIVVGASAIALGVVYIVVPEFRVVFWIIVGCLIAVYGLLVVIFALLDKEL